jgi:ribonuclease P protein component
LETKPRAADLAPAAVRGARFGFTVTKKLGGAVVRNRIRRRLKAAITLVADGIAKPDHDYVLVARLAAFDRDFEALKKDLERALHRVHHAPAADKRGAP